MADERSIRKAREELSRVFSKESNAMRIFIANIAGLSNVED